MNKKYFWVLNENDPNHHGKLAEIVEGDLAELVGCSKKDRYPTMLVAGRSSLPIAGRTIKATPEYSFRFACIGDKCIIDTECESGFLESWLNKGKEITIKKIEYGKVAGSITEPENVPICVTNGRDLHWLDLYALKLKE